MAPGRRVPGSREVPPGMSYEGVVEKDEKGYLVRLPDEVVASIRWKEGDRVKIELSEWRGRVVIVIYK